MPEVATVFKKGDTMGVVESVKAVSDVFAPVSGEVSEINVTLEDHPEYVNTSPYKDGWIVKIKIAKDSEFEDLMDNESYERYVQQEMENG
jgi:glycine cleavage system H protein